MLDKHHAAHLACESAVFEKDATREVKQCLVLNTILQVKKTPKMNPSGATRVARVLEIMLSVERQKETGFIFSAFLSFSKGNLLNSIC